MGKKYFVTKENTLESSILGVWKEAAKKVDETGYMSAPVMANRQLKDPKKEMLVSKGGKVIVIDKTKWDEMKKQGWIQAEDLTPKQKKIDVDGDGEIEGSDLAKLRKKGAKKEGLEDSPNKANSQHLCAKNVVHEEWGEGQPVHGMHAEPDEDGNIAWYDVMFEHGVEKGISINELKVTEAGMHASHDKDKEKLLAKKKHHKEGVEEFAVAPDVPAMEVGTDRYRDYVLELTPGEEDPEWVRARDFKVQSMKEALAKVWGLAEKKTQTKEEEEEEEELKPVKGSKTMTGGKPAKVEISPKAP